MTHSAFQTLPTFRPKLPTAAAILPLLEEIDASRWYSNFGPLARRLEAQLAEHFGVEPGRVVTVSNATMGIGLALKSAVDDRGGLCLMPAWTFAATPIAARAAGLTPFFADVDPESWQLTPERARTLAGKLAGQVRAVVPVAPFGAPPDLEAWAAFSDETGLPVVIDAAAAFDAAQPHPALTSVVSLHATKVLGIGDGGFVLADTRERAERLRRMSNFGFSAERCSILPGTNAKLSEYAAAVGLAALASWSNTRRAWLAQAAAFGEHLSGIEGIACRSPAFAASTFNVELDGGRADALVSWLNLCSIEARKWWANGCHRHPAFAMCPREPLPVTERLAANVVALPFWIDMSDEEMELVAESVRRFPATGPARP